MHRLAGVGLLDVRPGPSVDLTERGLALLARRTGGLIGQMDSVLKLFMDVPVAALPNGWTVDDDMNEA